MRVQQHAALTCHCGAIDVLAPVIVGGIALFYCATCAQNVVDDLSDRSDAQTTEPTGWERCFERCVCGARADKIATLTSLKVGCAFAMCERCTDKMVDGFRSALASRRVPLNKGVTS